MYAFLPFVCVVKLSILDVLIDEAATELRVAMLLTLLCDLEAFLTAQHHRLQHLVRTDVRLEVARVPQLAQQLAEALHQQEHAVARRALDAAVVLFAQEIVAQRRHVREHLQIM